MKALALYALEVLACSGVLLAAYAILLERRVRFGWCRVYLLLSTLLAAVIPLLRIPVWPGPVIEVAPAVAVPAADWTAEVVGEATPTLTPETVCLAVYLLGAALIAGVMLWQAVRIRRLRRGAEITRTDRFTLVRTPQRIASFSFFRSIYVWDQTPVREMKAIVAHEASHIAHRHSAERIAMECMKAALWWNPFVWITARRLTEAEEFEADSDVLAGGYDIEDYMKTIFRQLFGYSPEIANGLRDSLTKKRFKMMTTKTPGRYALLRLAGTLPALIGLLCAFSFTTRAAEFRTPETVEAPADTATKNVRIKVSKDGRPLSGAIILVAGSTKGTVTDAEGNASIDAQPGATLVISYVGCETEKIRLSDQPGAEGHILALKAETNDLAPVSVPPGGQKASAAEAGQGGDHRKIDIQIQLIEIKKDNIDTSRPATGATIKVVGSTKGVVANDTGLARIDVAEGSVLEILYPGYQRTWLTTNTESYYRIALVPEDAQTNHPKMRIRSEKGMQAEPLYIVDGVEQADIDNLNANEVLSMSVLKDQVSTALYGPRGKNGVIIITTRRSAKPVTEEATFDPATGAIKTADAGRDEPFFIAEAMPLFQGGDLNAFRSWTQRQILYPAEAMKQGIEGRVVVTFVVEADGSVDDIRILQSPDQLLTDEARRVIASSPAGSWTPGQQRGKNVAVKYTLPVDFRLTKTEPAPARNEATFDPATGTIQTAPGGDDEPFLIVETMPSFQGGDILAFRKWVQMHIKYPSEALKEKLYGRVVTSFIVEKDGSVSNIDVLQSPGKALADEARRVIGSVPAGAWTPGRQRGQAVRVKYTMPVDFRIQDVSGEQPERTEKPKGSIDEVIVVGYGDPK